ncbi:hypothetical protein PIB30_070593 [Stylosanthes scabra]|uniref:Uncharacterized protein n=1 Tax=Stylosanthes scabra TaxID=79078 RepID=A0ABU6ZM76_9FABA|nr:hypothetical protein [Stylosanthes scabra]
MIRKIMNKTGFIIYDFNYDRAERLERTITRLKEANERLKARLQRLTMQKSTLNEEEIQAYNSASKSPPTSRVWQPFSVLDLVSAWKALHATCPHDLHLNLHVPLMIRHRWEFVVISSATMHSGTHS